MFIGLCQAAWAHKGWKLKGSGDTAGTTEAHVRSPRLRVDTSGRVPSWALRLPKLAVALRVLGRTVTTTATASTDTSARGGALLDSYCSRASSFSSSTLTLKTMRSGLPDGTKESPTNNKGELGEYTFCL